MEPANGTTMTIGQLSRRTGVPIKALREYADGGLIYTRRRSPAGYRLFDTDALWCVRLIGRLRGLGLTIAEIHQLCHAYVHQPGQPPDAHLQRLLHAAKDRIDERIAALQQTRERIERFEAAQTTAPSGTPDIGLFGGDPRAADAARVACC